MFYNPLAISEYDFLLNFVVSERGGGKTFSSLKFCIEKYLEAGVQFIYTRRTETELELAAPNLLQPLQVEGFFQDHKFLVKNNVIFCDGKEMGKCVAISTAYKLKSVSFAKVKYIIFDEFISEDNNYLKNEPEKFLSLLETIGRMRDISVFLLGNQITIYNPYYAYFKVKPSNSPLTRFRDRSILIYQFSSEEYRNKKLNTKFGKLIQHTRYGDYLLNNENINDDYSFIDKLDNFKKYPIGNIIIDSKNISVYEVIIEDEFYLFFQMREPIAEVRTTNFDKLLIEGSISGAKSSNIAKRITNYLRRGNVRFKDIPTKLLIQNFIF